jgi:SAM-dependent methyltransferase
MLEPPPDSHNGLKPEFPVRQAFYLYFEPFFNKLECHYHSRFKWFLNDFAHTDTIVNIGFGKGGAETFALMWMLPADVSIGIDVDLSSARQANRNKKAAIDLTSSLVINVRRYCSPEYRDQFDKWYQEKVKPEIRQSILPNFIVGNVIEGLPCRSGWCSLVYSRYLLDKVEAHCRRMVFSEMIRILKPEGHVIIVAPENAFSFDVSGLSVELVKVVEKEQLGDLEWPQNPPIGKIYRKRAMVKAC